MFWRSFERERVLVLARLLGEQSVRSPARRLLLGDFFGQPLQPLVRVLQADSRFWLTYSSAITFTARAANSGSAETK